MDTMLTSRQVREKCGNVSDMSLWRWTRHAGFPEPVRLNRRRYWRAGEVDAWWEARAAAERAA